MNWWKTAKSDEFNVCHRCGVQNGCDCQNYKFAQNTGVQQGLNTYRGITNNPLYSAATDVNTVVNHHHAKPAIQNILNKYKDINAPHNLPRAPNVLQSAQGKLQQIARQKTEQVLVYYWETYISKNELLVRVFPSQGEFVTALLDQVLPKVIELGNDVGVAILAWQLGTFIGSLVNRIPAVQRGQTQAGGAIANDVAWATSGGKQNLDQQTAANGQSNINALVNWARARSMAGHYNELQQSLQPMVTNRQISQQQMTYILQQASASAPKQNQQQNQQPYQQQQQNQQQAINTRTVTQ